MRVSVRERGSCRERKCVLERDSDSESDSESGSESETESDRVRERGSGKQGNVAHVILSRFPARPLFFEHRGGFES